MLKCCKYYQCLYATGILVYGPSTGSWEALVIGGCRVVDVNDEFVMLFVDDTGCIVVGGGLQTPHRW